MKDRPLIDNRETNYAAFLESAFGKENQWKASDLSALWCELMRMSQRDLEDVVNTGNWLTCRNPKDSSCSLEALLIRSEASIASLTGIKNLAKSELKSKQSGIPQDLWQVLYYTSISASLVHHSNRISRLEDRLLLKGIRWCLRQPWLDTENKGILEKAAWTLASKSADRPIDGGHSS